LQVAPGGGVPKGVHGEALRLQGRAGRGGCGVIFAQAPLEGVAGEVLSGGSGEQGVAGAGGPFGEVGLERSRFFGRRIRLPIG
jgi:hypothetical protein